MTEKKTLKRSISSLELEDLASDLKQPDLFGQSPSVNKTNSAKPSCESTGPMSQSTTTSKPSTTQENATSSQAATPASPFPPLGSAKAQKMTATSGRLCLKLLSKKDPLGSFAKMLLVTSQWGSTRCYLTWRVKATPQGRLLFQLAPSMLRTDVPAFLSSPAMWPTPTRQDNPQVRGVGKTVGTRRGTTLGGAVRMASHHRGSLNPTWVEWLMGFPTGWTDLKPSEMPLSRKSSNKSAKQSSRQVK